MVHGILSLLSLCRISRRVETWVAQTAGYPPGEERVESQEGLKLDHISHVCGGLCGVVESQEGLKHVVLRHAYYRLDSRLRRISRRVETVSTILPNGDVAISV